MKGRSPAFVTGQESGTTGVRGLSCETVSTDKDNEQRKERTRLEGIRPPPEYAFYTCHDEQITKLLFDSVAQFGDRYHTQKTAILVNVRQPSNGTLIWPRLTRLGDDVRVEQKIHSPLSRSRTEMCFNFTPELRNRDAARNSARFPLRLAFCSQCSAATITAVVRPCFVILGGPSDFALSSSLLNFALASATVHVCGLKGYILNLPARGDKS